MDVSTSDHDREHCSSICMTSTPAMSVTAAGTAVQDRLRWGLGLHPDVVVWYEVGRRRPRKMMSPASR